MTSRNLTVNLTANTRRYRSALRMAERSTHGLGNSLGDVSRKLAMIGGAGALAGIAAIGATAAVVGVQATKSFLSFEQTLAKIEGLVGVSKEELAGMTDELKRISAETARGPQELAEALFFITSAGLRGADAIAALEASAKAAAAGLGETQIIADAVTSAVNAYGAEMLDAGTATDIMIATVREGKAEAPALAQAFGRVIPIAAAMGVEFNEIGAALAAMTRTGLNADEATTALRQILVSLLNPAAGAEAAIEGLGLSVDGLQGQLSDEGLLPTLFTLQEAFADNDVAATAVFGNIRALTGVLSLLGPNAEATEQIFANLTDTTGMMDQAFGIAADTGAFKLSQAWNEIQLQLLDIGAETLPKVLEILREIQPAIGPAVDALGDLAIAMADLAVDFAPFLISALQAFATFGTNLELGALRLKDNLDNIFADIAFDLANFPVGALDVILGPGINMPDLFQDLGEFTKADQLRVDFLNTTLNITKALQAGVDPMRAYAAGIGDLATRGAADAKAFRDLQETFGLTDEALGQAVSMFLDSAAAAALSTEEYRILEGITLRYTDAASAAASATNREAEAQLAASRNAERLAGEASNAAAAALLEQIAADELAESLTPLEVRLQAAAEAQESLADVMSTAIGPVAAARGALDNYRRVLRQIDEDGERTADEQFELIAAMFELQSALDGLTGDQLEAALDAIAEGLGITRFQAILLLEEMGLMKNGVVVTTGALEDLTGALEAGDGPVGPLVEGYEELVEEGVAPLEDALRDAEEAQESLTDVLRAAADPVFAAVRAMGKYKDTMKEISDPKSPGGAAHTAEEQLKLAESLLDLQSSLDGLSGQELENALDAIGTALDLTRQGVIDLLTELDIMDGTSVRTFLEIETRQTGNRFQFGPSDDGGGGSLDSFPNLSSIIGGLQRFHDSGVVAGLRGSDVPILAQAGEVLLQPSHLAGLMAGSGSRSTTVQVVAPPGMSAADLRLGVVAGLLTAGVREQVEFLGVSDI
jgi:TP901 family phage tail tape measure protein